MRGSRSSAGLSAGADGGGVDAELAQYGGHDAIDLLEQDREQMLRRGLGIVSLRGQQLGGGQRLLGLDGEAIWMHERSLFESAWRKSLETQWVSGLPGKISV